MSTTRLLPTRSNVPTSPVLSADRLQISDACADRRRTTGDTIVCDRCSHRQHVWVAALELMQDPHESAASDPLVLEQAHVHDSDHTSKALKVSFLDWARRRKAQLADTKDGYPSESYEIDVSEPDLPGAGTEAKAEAITTIGNSYSPLFDRKPIDVNSIAIGPRYCVIRPQSSIHPHRRTRLLETMAISTDIVMNDPPASSINGQASGSGNQNLKTESGTDAPDSMEPGSSSGPHTQLVLDEMDVDPVAPTANMADMGQIRASPASFADGASYQPSASHAPPNPPSPLPVLQFNSSPGVLSALTKR
ncbi:hypothetical protein RhiJN_08811 [Ceratobasidium sp. AG-Ba]|nr:hypothetical protein RhiJN_08811 [Ceratobasidium sp. AG-Ba]